MVRLLVLIIVVLVSSRASADTGARHVLRWTRAPGAEACIDPHALRAAVDARLGRAVFLDDERRAIRIEGDIHPTETGWRVAISVHGPDAELLGERKLEEPSADCRVLDDALVLMVALIVDPDAAMREPQPPAAPPTIATQRPPSSAEATITTPRSPPPKPTPAPVRTSEPLRVATAATIIGGVAVLPGGSGGGALRVIVDGPVLPPIALRGTVWWPDEQRQAEHGARFSLVTGGVALCPAVWRLALCGGIELGRMTGEGFGFDRSQHSAALVSYVTLEPRLGVPLTARLAMTASIGAWIPLVRPRFVFEQGGQDVELFQPGSIALATELGLRLHF